MRGKVIMIGPLFKNAVTQHNLKRSYATTRGDDSPFRPDISDCPDPILDANRETSQRASFKFAG